MDAVLLLGPTGAGKSPLGDVLEARGLSGRHALHFDFGAQLRAAAAGEATQGLGEAERAVIGAVLEQGRLLENHEFPIAAALLDAFLSVRGAGATDLVVLNGLPRHVGQARALEGRLRVKAVVRLEASSEVVHARIRLDTGGDRAGREDDEAARIERRIARYEARALPLIEHYARGGAQLIDVPVSVETTAEDAYARVVERLT